MTTDNPSTERATGSATDTDRATGIGSATGAGATRGRFVSNTPPAPGTDRANGTNGTDRTNGTRADRTETDPRADRADGTATGTVPAPRSDRTDTDRTGTDRTDTGRTGTDPRADRTSTDVDTDTDTARAYGDRTDTAPRPTDMTKTAEPARPRSTAGNPTVTDGADLLLPPELTSRLTGRLDHAVGTFVDDPNRAVQEADEALDETVRVLTDRLQERRTALRDAWRNGGDRGAADAPSRTEDLRLSLRAYRDLLHQLLAA
ncbi:hypothetical protein HUT16_31720 [Kitasatospora sp. NA04385]|uniref:hypothetical protein n=1 Tax=Kitasatospora sp. NA04385 TaxID=2742135 RepID=UPI001591AF6E|nr:hypothetical protein [Kitasatospora sp. NA04385]QKW23049.1 hypothetical protein HUT16_31720 [Kitasatospora sp. NA04385]